MILDNLYSINMILMLFLMLLFSACFVRFIYKELGGVKVGRDSFLFFDYMLFCSGWKANLPASTLALVSIFGSLYEYIKTDDMKTLYASIICFFAALALFIHCRFFSDIFYDGKKIKFIRELFLNFKINLRYVFLWLSRALYIAFIILSYKY